MWNFSAQIEPLENLIELISVSVECLTHLQKRKLLILSLNFGMGFWMKFKGILRAMNFGTF